MSKAMQIPVAEKWLSRQSNTTSQTRKGRYERWENVSEAFACASGKVLTGKTILLVDDVLTTGATLEACARPLQQAGASVLIATLACSLR
jgi:predicted amidophosphoribosyltransferase